ncbi:GNAT family N-acetyltransferase [Chitinimonas arctica]|uniref:GNAT family N-acetyltransferase n=1 Tax=Chitinimonas arctica TaxID=2594795 RepID=A0A516SE22_9NEIS|nr:GNAT family N-acetyltransferase [Chitinimonas arctica]QDQ26268.1 GNAT family N-acetyltransferase [Chitinimonas arctica]
MNPPPLLENAFVGASFNSLFHTPAFFNLHATAESAYFEWAPDRAVVANIHFTSHGEGLWRSPARGTYAGYAVEPGLRLRQFAEFHTAVQARLAERGARRLEVLPAPMAHDPVAFSNQFQILRSSGFEISTSDLNYTLAVDATPLGERMSYGNLKRLRKCTREGLLAEPLPISELPAVYETIAANRASKGHTVSMTLSQLETMAAQLPDAIQLFGCRDGEQLAAAGLCLRLNPQVLYVFYWGDRPGYEQFSPVVAVADAIYRFAQEQGIALLDAGTSTVDRDINHGLIEFKRALGFTESLKLRMTKVLP